MPGGRAFENEVSPELPPRVGAVDEHELAVQHLAVALLGALEHAVLAGTAGADAHQHAGERAGRNELGEIKWRWGRAVIVRHGCLLCFRQLWPGCSRPV